MLSTVARWTVMFEKHTILCLRCEGRTCVVNAVQLQRLPKPAYRHLSNFKLLASPAKSLRDRPVWLRQALRLVTSLTYRLRHRRRKYIFSQVTPGRCIQWTVQHSIVTIKLSPQFEWLISPPWWDHGSFIRDKKLHNVLTSVRIHLSRLDLLIYLFWRSSISCTSPFCIYWYCASSHPIGPYYGT